MKRIEQWGWLAVALVLCAFAIPWFLWGDATIVAGLPLWLWWHVGWMVLASAVFWLFARRAWGVGIEPDATASASESGGDRP
ncbi:DUF3311 domain-containing protein [Halopiger goleimassiliensis]|uniref:DUF3311 domain-containing protein n=1 Tax=Halopiger goleimassiliensis TaxID=1293048 RepID=UPI000677F9FC|nr:DUF3311 domain-containing protein [Halopiger goleimassiliensis]